MKLRDRLEERRRRREEWSRIDQLEKDVRQIQNDMKAIADAVHQQPTLRKAQ